MAESVKDMPSVEQCNGQENNGGNTVSAQLSTGGEEPSINNIMNNDVDDELDDLLDSALEDFAKPLTATTASDGTNIQAAGAPAATSQSSGRANIGNLADLGPSLDADMQGFEDVLSELIGDDTDLAQQFSRLSTLAGQMDGSETSQREFAGTLQDTLAALAGNADQLEADVSEEDLLAALSGGGGGGDGMMGAMTGMMKSLLSCEVLYPALKEISTKYPEWLTSNKESLSSADHSRFENQLELMTQICTEFETEAPADSEERKQQRFEHILEALQKMQQYGQPPEQLVSTLENAMPQREIDLSADMNTGEQCSLM